MYQGYCMIKICTCTTNINRTYKKKWGKKIKHIVNTTVSLKLFPLHSVNTASTKKHEMADRRKRFFKIKSHANRISVFFEFCFFDFFLLSFFSLCLLFIVCKSAIVCACGLKRHHENIN